MLETWMLRIAAAGLALPVVLEAQTVDLPGTGQSASYDASSPRRDDGAVRAGAPWPQPRFTDNGDGTLTDDLTGLMWLEDANSMATEYPGFDNDGTSGDGAVTWQHALDFVAGIDDGTYPGCAAGHGDWRLANRKELHSLTDFSQYHPALPAAHAFVNVQSDPYWSSTTYASITAFGWYVDLYSGSWSWNDKAGAHRFVWPVRGGAGLDDIFADGFESGNTSAWSTVQQKLLAGSAAVANEEGRRDRRAGYGFENETGGAR